jgi:hypothetical protein
MSEMKFDDWFIAQFRDVLSEPLGETDCIPDSEIEAALNGSSIPESVRTYFRVAGKHWLNTNHNHWLPLGAFQTMGDFTIFMDENQCVVRWGFRAVDMNSTDPIVYQAQPISDPLVWHSEEKPFSQFIIAMWQWVLTGVDPQ